MDDRTGELCGICKKGKLRPSGYREFESSDKIPSSGLAQRECTEYECDVCGNKCKAHAVVLNDSIGSCDTVRVDKKKH